MEKIPGQVPWTTIKGKLLESLLHELLIAIGAENIKWRTGGIGPGTADGGRDLEAEFTRTSPDGSVERELWWIEAKGRTRSVEPDAVKSAVLNASGHQNVDVLVIASNSEYTNPTRDWVSEWSRGNKRPRVRLWDRATLDRLVREHPVASARALPDLLEGKERLNLIVDQFDEAGRTPLQNDLDYFWENRALVTGAKEISCLAYAEMILGDIVLHPWGTEITEESALACIVEALVAMPIRQINTQVLASDKATHVAAYLIESALPFLDPKAAQAVLNNPYLFLEEEHWRKFADNPQGFREIILTPIWETVCGQLLDACSQDCVRLSVDPNTTLGRDPSGPWFWRRFNADLPVPDERILIIEGTDKPCAVGLDLSGSSCPLLGKSSRPDFSISEQEITDIRNVILFRRERPDGMYSELSDVKLSNVGKMLDRMYGDESAPEDNGE